jgi:predicted FMN-binding regulatory protein PaiB
MSQNRLPQDRDSVIKHLTLLDDAASAAMLDEMRR